MSDGHRVPATSPEEPLAPGTPVIVNMDGFQVGLVCITVRTEIGGVVIGAGPFGVNVRLNAVFAGIEEMTVSPDRLTIAP